MWKLVFLLVIIMKNLIGHYDVENLRTSKIISLQNMKLYVSVSAYYNDNFHYNMHKKKERSRR